MAQIQLKSLLGKADMMLEEGYHFLGYVLLKSGRMENIIEQIADAVPSAVNEAEAILRRKDEIIQEAHNRAERIIQEGINEQNRLVSEHEVYRRVQEQVIRQQQQVAEFCENLKSAAAQEAEEIKIRAVKEAGQIQKGAEDYAERIFNSLDSELENFLASVKQCKIMLADQKSQNELNRQASIGVSSAQTESEQPVESEGNYSEEEQ